MCEKSCYQLIHPMTQTDCFTSAGGVPCSADFCAVYRAIANDNYLRSLPFEEQKSFIVCNFLHYVCRMSSFSSDPEFFQRTRRK